MALIWARCLPWTPAVRGSVCIECSHLEYGQFMKAQFLILSLDCTHHVHPNPLILIMPTLSSSMKLSLHPSGPAFVYSSVHLTYLLATHLLLCFFSFSFSSSVQRLVFIQLFSNPVRHPSFPSVSASSGSHWNGSGLDKGRLVQRLPLFILLLHPSLSCPFYSNHCVSLRLCEEGSSLLPCT